MRAWILLGLCLALPFLADVSLAEDSPADINAVSKSWDKFARLSGQDKPESVELLAASSFRHFGFLRDAALYASAEQLRRIPAADRLLVYLLRASQTPEALKDMDDEAIARLCVSKGWTGVSQDQEGQPTVALSHVTLLGERAVSEVAPPTETRYQFGPDFVREDGRWKYRYESMALDASESLEQTIRQSGTTSNRVLEYAIGNLLGKPADSPALATLDRSTQDNADARARLNENWPDYTSTYRYRFEALAKKADEGDSLAQAAMGTLMIEGSAPEYVKQDEARGWQLLEKASEQGRADAAWLVFAHLMDDKSQYGDALFQRAVVHLQRAAAAANPDAMGALGLFYFEGVGGLQRDCRQAAEWQARSEEAGAANARNDQVWTWSVCPIREQRDPAKAIALAAYMMENEDTLGSSELDTVAAALAANRRFDEAGGYQQRAIDKLGVEMRELDDPKPNPATLKRMKARLAGYRQGKDYVQDYNTFDEMKAGRY